ncbi:PREDICTED: NADH dehydrogenase [ubiquinone] 1 subunit C2 [Gavialis gangeticus]|uniref:NADH dehydrogenase [ubiquinone] 1 subunit C2 n=1 Tax=Gavialis gangeticus TaxID=94835 RepID=UPI00092F06BB|nr:PREDICTED: NADH dehydrogenase [ubiquinone] 1 subunit C2 [Gavialis gangeticus]
MSVLPDESRSLPPPNIVNHNSVVLASIGWAAVVLNNLGHRRPALGTGVHRQILAISIGWFVGYYATRRENYYYACRDRALYQYIKHHPEDFQPKERKKMAEVLEPFHSIR